MECRNSDLNLQSLSSCKLATEPLIRSFEPSLSYLFIVYCITFPFLVGNQLLTSTCHQMSFLNVGDPVPSFPTFFIYFFFKSQILFLLSFHPLWPWYCQYFSWTYELNYQYLSNLYLVRIWNESPVSLIRFPLFQIFFAKI